MLHQRSTNNPPRPIFLPDDVHFMIDFNSISFLEVPSALDLPRTWVNQLVPNISSFNGARCEKFGRDNSYSYFECTIRQFIDPVIGHVIVLSEHVTIDEGAVTVLSRFRL